MKGRTVYWPGEADVGRLVDMYFEVNCANAHRFDCGSTPVVPGDVVLDVGCCEGFFALRALEQGGGEGLLLRAGTCSLPGPRQDLRAGDGGREGDDRQ